ncbi:MAG: DHH family phosphoesterase [Kiritimatiellia bacterium]
MNPLVARILEHRGIGAAELDDFLHPTLDRLAKPEELPGVVEAADAILSALSERCRIVVFGDYDCDGVCATAILSRTLRALGGNVAEFVPDRLKEGYGMSDASVARMLAEHPGVGLVVTVDNGINSLDQVADLKAKGVPVVVTDHHLPTYAATEAGETGEMLLPDALAVVNPKVAAPASLSGLCGAGVAFLLANRVVAEARARGLYSGPGIGGPLLVMAGLATVTDIMPLLGQNRILVAEALRRFLACAPLGLRELHARAARNAYGELTTRDFGFMLGPRINAAGRIASGMEALELLLSDDREITRELARIIDCYNVERKAIEQEMVDRALEKVVPSAAAQVIDLPDGHPGVAGIVAARVMERLGETVPVCVYARGHGSARAPDGFNIRDAFVACADSLDRFGGHAAAGGFSVKEGRIDDFRRLLCEYCARQGQTAASGTAVREPDLWVEPSDLTLSLAEDLQRLEPFGEGNPEPVFGLRGVFFSDVRTLGADGRHLAVTLRKSGLRAIRWSHGDQVERLRAESAVPHDLTCTVVLSDYGERHVELRIVSIS